MKRLMALIGIFALMPTLLFAKEQPRLVLQITVDQLRGDLPAKYLDKMGKGGFRYLLDKGVVYEDAHHNHSNTETIVGHATLATGANPADHGLVGNVWFDRVSGEMIYNIEDVRYPLLTAGADVNQQTEIDPTQKIARSDGRSPAAILTTTFSDELALHTNNKAKIFGVSVKDRGAVSMAGHSGKAFWFSKAKGEFVTSHFYYDDYPQWVQDFNAAGPAQRYADQAWELSLEQSSYEHAGRDDQPWETSLGSFGRVFPHAYGPADGKYFTTFLTLSPAGDEMTLEFAKALIVNEGVGADDVTDYLSVSFSSTDYVGHVFGPSSLEGEDNLLRLDRTLADLLDYVDQKVGLRNTLIVLSAEHGGPEAPPLLNEYGVEADYVDTDNWDKESGIKALKQRFGIGEELIRQFWQPYVYLNDDAIRKQGLDKAEVEAAVAKEMNKFAGVRQAISSTALLNGQVADTELTRLILNNHNVRRAGDVFVVFEPQWFINDFDGLTVATTHGSPWPYDTYVPVIFAGNRLKPQRVARRIHTTDVASTLSEYTGTNRPSGARGAALKEIISQAPVE